MRDAHKYYIKLALPIFYTVSDMKLTVMLYLSINYAITNETPSKCCKHSN